MKKLFSVFSLGVLLFSSLAPSFTYANSDIEEVSSLLNSILEETSNEFQETTSQIKSTPELRTYGVDETGLDEIEYINNNEHFVWNKTAETITVYNNDFSSGVTLKDKNVGATSTDITSEDSYGNYYMRGYFTEYDYSDFNNYNPTGRQIGEQGNCDKGFHIPQISEFEKPNYRLYQISKGEEIYLYDYLRLPLAGFMNYQGEFQNEYVSPAGVHFGLYLVIEQGRTIGPSENSMYLSPGGCDPRGGGVIRCFKDNYLETLTLKIGDETILTQFEHGDSFDKSLTGQLLSNIDIPEGYHVEWYITGDNNELTGFDFENEEITTTKTIIGQIETNTDTEYKVKHLGEPLEGDEYILLNEETLTGTTNGVATGEYKLYEGFTGESIEDKTIEGDGSTVVIINYSRNSHNLTIDGNTSETKYGAEIILSEGTKDGYHLVEWQGLPTISGDNKYYMPDEDVVITGVWEKNPEPTPSAGGGRPISTIKQETKLEQEHNSADTEENKTQEQTATSVTAKSEKKTVEEKIEIIKPKALTRGELAVFSNILLDIFPKLTENKKNVNDVCTEYTDYQEFSSKEQKAVSKLCRLAIMGINEDDKTPLETFGVHNLSTNEEFIKVVNRMTDKYSEEELKDLKSALSSLEENKEENLSFGTVVNIFKKVKNLFE